MKAKAATFKRVILASVISLVIGNASAQTEKLEMEQKPLPPLPSSISGRDSIDTVMQNFLKAQKDPELDRGDQEIDGRTVLVMLGKGVINFAPTDKNFVAGRVVGFQRAMLDVKEQCAKLQETRISSEMLQDFKSPGEQRAMADAQRLQREGLAQEGAIQVAKAMNSDIKAKNLPSSLQTAGLYGEKILENKMKEELKKKGLDPNKSVSDQEVKSILSTSTFKAHLRATARARCTGIKVLASFESNPASGKGQLGVIGIWSRQLHEVADAVVTGDYSRIPKGAPGLPIKKHIPEDLRTLLSTFGTQLLRDESGGWNILAFGQAQPLSTDQQNIDIAYKIARLQAEGMLRSFLGESITSTNDLRETEEATTYEGQPSEQQMELAFNLRVQAIAPKLPVSGIVQVHEWETLHPSYNRPVVGVVLRWRVESSKFAGLLKTVNQESATKANEATARMNSGSASASASKQSGGPSSQSITTPKSNNPNSGGGVRSRDF